MFRRCFIFILCLCPVIASGQETSVRATAGEMAEGIACRADSSQTYTLYLPEGFENTKKWPVLLIFDPRGRSVFAAGLFQEAADRFGWILVSSDNSRSDETWEPNLVALKSLWPEVLGRLPSDPNRIYAAGFSGGAAVAYLLAKTTQEVAGIIACGGRFFPDQLDGTTTAIFATAGETDFNYDDMHLVAEYMAEHDRPGRIVTFDGAHSWMPTQVATEAVAWLELIAMARGALQVDDGFIDDRWQAGLGEGLDLMESGNEFEAVRRLDEMVRAFEELRDISELQRRADEIREDEAYRAQRKTARRAREYWSDCRDRVLAVTTPIRAGAPIRSRGWLEREIGLEKMRDRAEQEDALGRAARQCLGTTYANLSFYTPRELFERKRWSDLAASYEVALSIRDGNPVIWYNLACAQARANRADDAMASLQRALDLGFNQPDLLRSDEDLESLRDREDFKALVVEILD